MTKQMTQTKAREFVNAFYRDASTSEAKSATALSFAAFAIFSSGVVSAEKLTDFTSHRGEFAEPSKRAEFARSFLSDHSVYFQKVSNAYESAKADKLASSERVTLPGEKGSLFVNQLRGMYNNGATKAAKILAGASAMHGAKKAGIQIKKVQRNGNVETVENGDTTPRKLSELLKHRPQPADPAQGRGRGQPADPGKSLASALDFCAASITGKDASTFTKDVQERMSLLLATLLAANVEPMDANDGDAPKNGEIVSPTPAEIDARKAKTREQNKQLNPANKAA